MRFVSLFLICLLLTSCEESVSSANLPLLEGYWEIEEVIFPDGNSKTYSINTTIDYFEHKEKKGFRKKVQPRLNGTYATSDDAVSFEIMEKNDKFILIYKNELSQWEEEIKSLSNEKLVLASTEGVVYNYKRFEAIDIESGKEE